MTRVGVIGAGCSGLTTAKRLQDFGISYDHFELSDDVGGNWYFRNPNGRSSVYESLHIDTSTGRLEFEDFPAPSSFPDFPHHTQIHDYLRAYADHCGLRDKISFGVGVERARPTADGWDVTLTTGETRSYTDLVVANGHHWSLRLPDWPGEFAGELIHSHHYVNPFEPVEMRGKRVVAVGMGNSVMDIASELSSRWRASTLYVSARRGVWVLPKYRNGVAADKVMAPAGRAARRRVEGGSRADQGARRVDEQLRPARTRPRAALRAPVGERGLPHPRGLRRHPHAAGDRAADHLAQYYAAPRHTIQIDFGRYVVDLMAEIEAGEARAAART